MPISRRWSAGGFGVQCRQPATRPGGHFRHDCSHEVPTVVPSLEFPARSGSGVRRLARSATRWPSKQDEQAYARLNWPTHRPVRRRSSQPAMYNMQQCTQCAATKIAPSQDPPAGSSSSCRRHFTLFGPQRGYAAFAHADAISSAPVPPPQGQLARHHSVGLLCCPDQPHTLHITRVCRKRT